MNVGIQEMEHFEGVYPVIRLFDTGRNRLFLFVNKTVYHRLLDLFGEDANRFEWIIQQENESTHSFCRRIGRTVQENQVSLLYLNTVSKHHIFYARMLAKLKGVESVLTVHDVNCLFHEKFSLEPRRFARYLGKKWLTRCISAFNTVSETVKPALAALAGKGKRVFTVPGAVYEKPGRFVPVGQGLEIVIPGSLDSKRRDYEQVFRLHEMTAGLPLNFTLLGGGKEDDAIAIRARCRSIGSGRLRWFDTGIVDQHIFDEELDRAHFLWIPSVVDTRICGDIPEIYGITKSSGNIFDIIKHAKPFIYPETLCVQHELRSAGISYNSLENLVYELKLILETPGLYRKWATEAERASRLFTIEKVRTKQYPLFEGRTGTSAASF
ncbi:hypothetical protein ACFSQD_03770 [Flavihumibacter stibioxidans]|uniref:Glycosyltransferase involved in cell wall biosynthesis n=1 Tax=Flavihumibacter stibioxidans TaxID=1834163 RepID=A0ABR7M378_9BACT|nr:hypothetical protein [Flavihumibacter stibioxidans]MBC6489427.1 hypothetical protein [Flavihumibacter stibioxidans]